MTRQPSKVYIQHLTDLKRHLFQEADKSVQSHFGIWALNAAENGGYPYLKQTTMLPVSYVAPTAGTVLMDSKTGGKYLVSTRSKAVSYAGVLDEEITSVPPGALPGI